MRRGCLWLLLAACTRAGTESTVTAGAPSLAPASSSSSAPPPPSTTVPAPADPFPAVAVSVKTKVPPRAFTDGGTVTFQPGVGLKKRRLAKRMTWAGTSADGVVSVLGFDMKGLIVTAKKPDGVPFPAAHVARTVFTADGGRVATLQYLGALIVLDTATGGVVHERKGALECDARFLDPGHVRLHEESKDKAARLYDLDLATGKQTPLSGKRRVSSCASSLDARSWLLHDEYAKDARVALLRVGPPATLEALLQTDGDGAVLSPIADRACFYDQGSVRCVRADHGEERVASGLTGASLEFDDTGARMLVQGSFLDAKEEPRSILLLVDFASGVVRKLVGPVLTSGGSVHLMSGGQVVATGSGAGVVAFDVEGKRRHALAHPAMYTVHAVAGAPRKLVGEEDNGGDPYLLEL